MFNKKKGPKTVSGSTRNQCFHTPMITPPIPVLNRFLSVHTQLKSPLQSNHPSFGVPRGLFPKLKVPKHFTIKNLIFATHHILMIHKIIAYLTKKYTFLNVRRPAKSSIVTHFWESLP